MGFLAGLSSSLAAVLAAGATFLACAAWDAAIDDPGVRRAARADYVRISEFEAAQADAEAARKLATLRAQSALRLRQQGEADAASLARFQAQLAAAQAMQEEMQDAIDELVRARPGGVPDVRDLGVRLRN